MNSIAMILIGDVLFRPKPDFRLVTHFGVAVAPDLVLQNTPDKGEHVVTVQKFSAGEPIAVHRTGVNPAVVINRAQAVLVTPSKYDLFKNNCEHTVTRVVQGVSKSPQLVFFVILLVVIGVLWFAVKRK